MIRKTPVTGPGGARPRPGSVAPDRRPAPDPAVLRSWDGRVWTNATPPVHR